MKCFTPAVYYVLSPERRGERGERREERGERREEIGEMHGVMHLLWSVGGMNHGKVDVQPLQTNIQPSV